MRRWTKEEKMELLELTITKDENNKYLSIVEISNGLKEKFGSKYREYTEPSVSNQRNSRLFPWARETIKEYEAEINHYLEIIKEIKTKIKLLHKAKEAEEVRLQNGNSRKYT